MQYIRNLLKYRFLIQQLVTRDFKVKYKRSVLGIAWSLLQPILTITVMYIVFSNFFRFSTPGVSYVCYLFSGMLYMNYFAEASNLAMSTIVANAGLINKVYVPKYIFPLTKCLFVGINFCMTLIPLYAVMLITGTGVSWHHLLLPYSYICLFLFTYGVGLILATVSVFLRDMFYIYTIVLTLLNYLTPLFWDFSIIDNPTLAFLLSCNPLYQIIDFGRTIMLYQQVPTGEQFLICGAVSVISALIGTVVFRKYQDEFIYHI